MCSKYLEFKMDPFPIPESLIKLVLGEDMIGFFFFHLQVKCSFFFLKKNNN